MTAPEGRPRADPQLRVNPREDHQRGSGGEMEGMLVMHMPALIIEGLELHARVLMTGAPVVMVMVVIMTIMRV